MPSLPLTNCQTVNHLFNSWRRGNSSHAYFLLGSCIINEENIIFLMEKKPMEDVYFRSPCPTVHCTMFFLSVFACRFLLITFTTHTHTQSHSLILMHTNSYFSMHNEEMRIVSSEFLICSFYHIDLVGCVFFQNVLFLFILQKSCFTDLLFVLLFRTIKNWRSDYLQRRSHHCRPALQAQCTNACSWREWPR